MCFNLLLSCSYWLIKVYFKIGESVFEITIISSLFKMNVITVSVLILFISFLLSLLLYKSKWSPSVLLQLCCIKIRQQRAVETNNMQLPFCCEPCR